MYCQVRYMRAICIQESVPLSNEREGEIVKKDGEGEE